MTTGPVRSVRDLVPDAVLHAAPMMVLACDEMMQLLALRVAAGRSTDESTDRDGADRAEPETDLARSGGHGPDPS